MLSEVPGEHGEIKDHRAATNFHIIMKNIRAQNPFHRDEYEHEHITSINGKLPAALFTKAKPLSGGK